MAPDNLIYIMTAAVVVAAVAIVIQTFLLFGMYLASKAMREQVTAFLGKVEPLVESAQSVVEQVRKQTGEIATRANDILDLSRTQLERIDEVLAEATERTRVQMDRIELVLDDTVARFQETTALLQRGIVKPMRQIGGVAAGVSSALSSFFGGHRPTPEQATHDEEMFIG
jgi:uncharacterized protein YoxC